MKYLFLFFMFTLSAACQQTDQQSAKKDPVYTDIMRMNRTGAIHNKNGNKEKALYYHNLALQKAKKYGIHELQVRALIGIAQVLKTDNADQSIFHLKKALHLSDSIGNQRLSAEIYRSLSEIYRQQANYKQSLQALEEHHHLLDKLMQADRGQRIALLRKTYQRDGILIAAIAILLVLFILLYYFRRTNKLNNELRAANQIKDKLFTIIGHDLRNPIGSITNVLSLIEADELTADEQRQMISQMHQQSNVSLEILNSLLKWGQAQLNGVTIKPVVFQASKVVQNNITALNGKALEKGLTILQQVSPDIRVKGDQDHFDFIARNLLSNAIKFSHQNGEITINATIEPRSSQIVFSVKDEGIGISQQQQKAFLSHHLDISFGTKGEKGTGIGLMLSQEFQKASGGRLWLESAEGQGTTFYFNYPCV